MAAVVTLTPRQQGITAIVKLLLVHRGMTRRKLAGRMGIHEATVGQKINGRLRWSIEDLEAMAEVFEVPVSRFFEEPDDLIAGLVAESPRTESNRRPSHYE